MPRQFDVILNCIMTESENISSKFTILIFLSEFLKRIKKVIHAPVNHLLIITILNYFAKSLKPFPALNAGTIQSAIVNFHLFLNFCLLI